MRFSKAMLPLILLSVAGALWAQAPTYQGVGRTPTPEEIQKWDISIGPTGKELPVGSGTANEGEKIFAAKCEMCHGPDQKGTPLAPSLVGGTGTLTTLNPVRTVGNYWPFATTIWDYINRAMPRLRGGTLTPHEVYSLTAFLLFRNGIIQETEVMDAKTLPKVQMPNRFGFLPTKLEDIHDLQQRGCHLGTCP